MNTESFTAVIRVDQPPATVFAAVNNVRGWWSEEIEGPTDRLGAEFSFHYKDLHRSTQRITSLIPDRRVVWHVVAARLNFIRDRNEWNGTDIVFDIATRDNQTELRFTHLGLVPACECFSDCSGAWGFYINDSLRSLIVTGKGQPNRAETEEQA